MGNKRASIIVPMHNASNNIENCLSSISEQTTKNFEVVLVDDFSTDDTVQKTRKYPFKIVRLRKNGGPAKARNYGAKNASGDIFIFVDSDVLLEPDSIEQVMSLISKPNSPDVVSGIYAENIPQTNFSSQLQNLILRYRFFKLSEFISFTNSAFCAIKRNAFEAVRGYNEEMKYYEDVEIGHRLVEKGYRCILNPSLKVTHLKYFSHLGLLCDYFKKSAASGSYKRCKFLEGKFKADELPLSIKIAGVSSGFVLLSIGLIKVNVIPFLLFLSIYSISMAPLLSFLVRARNLYFGLKSYIVCFEIFLISLVGLAYGLLGNKND